MTDIETYTALFGDYCEDLARRLNAVAKLTGTTLTDAIPILLASGMMPTYLAWERGREATRIRLQHDHDVAVATAVGSVPPSSVPPSVVGSLPVPSSGLPSGPLQEKGVSVEPLTGLEVDQIEALVSRMSKFPADRLTGESYRKIAQEIGGDRAERLSKRIDASLTKGYALQLRRVIAHIAWEG